MMNPYTTVLDMQRRAWKDATDLVTKAGVVPERRETMDEVGVGETPSEVVYTENKLRLRHYEPQTEEQHDVPILVVYALINRPYILDLQPDRSVVRTLLENGFDVYLIDWGEPSALDRSLTLEDYVDRYIDDCVDVVRERSGLDAINLLGYCMGGTMSVMYSSLHPEKVRNLGLMAAGLCFDDSGGVLELWGDGEFFDPDAVTDTFGNVPSEFLDIGFALMDPVQNTVSKYVSLYDNLENEAFVENFARMEHWLGDGIDVAGETYKQFIRDIYQENKLYNGELMLGDKRIDLDELDMPILQIVAGFDHLIPPEASTPFNEVVPSDDTAVIEARAGHIGLSVSSKAHEETWPQVCEWFAERSVVEVEEPADEPEGGTEDTNDDADADAALTSIEGIGSSYAARLENAGVATTEQLAERDPETLAAEIEVSAERVSRWVEDARTTEN